MFEKNNRLEEALNYKDRYCYDNGVLVNLLNISSQEELDSAESAICLAELAKLPKTANNFNFSLDYYLKIHKQIFRKIYPFAGDIRNVNMTKGKTPFCRPEFIANYLKELLYEMSIKCQKINSKEDYIQFLSHYYSEINIVHPFREGNGRTLREFLRQMVSYLDLKLGLNYELDYSNIDEITRSNLINGSILAAMKDDLTLLEDFFSDTLIEKENMKDYSNDKLK